MKRRILHLSFFVFYILLTSKIFPQIEPEKIELISNGSKLNAEIYRANSNRPTPALILMHGYPGGEGDPLGLGKKLSYRGVNVLVFNYRGTWSSEGEFSFENSMEDIGSAIDFLKMTENIEKYNIDTANIAVGGWSYGGAMALTAAIYNPEIQRIVSVAGADESVFGGKILEDVNYRRMFEKMLKETEYPNGPVKFNLSAYLEFWLSNLDKYDQVKHAESIKERDILLIAGLNDYSVLLEEHILPLYRELMRLESENTEMSVMNTDHSFREVREELTEKIYNWIINGTTVPDTRIDNVIAGTWKFVSLRGENSEGEIFYPYGEEPFGKLMYDTKGNMSVFLTRPDRPNFASGDIYKGTLEEIKSAFENFDAYCGTYEIDEENGTVTHHIEGSRFPNWEGSDQTRFFQLSNDTLSLGARIKAKGKDWELNAILIKQ